MNTQRFDKNRRQSLNAISAHLRISQASGVRKIPLGDTTLVGRMDFEALGSPDNYLSERHFSIERTDTKFTIKDLNSRNGTYVNGARIHVADLQSGDIIQAGTTEITFIGKNSEETNSFRTSRNTNWKQQLEKVPHMARTQYPILINGPSGTGKENLAQWVHELSSRHRQPFVSVNCSALNDNLVESELFGHAKGSFTGASQARKGAFEVARGGTLFLDEIGDLPLSIQPKILRALENQEIKPIGSDHVIRTNVRIVSATHHDLAKKALTGDFRQDLYYRLQVLQITPPALESRLEDFNDIVATLCHRHGTNFTPLAIEFLQRQVWPGNIRELNNFIARAKTFFPGKDIDALDVKNLFNTFNHLKNPSSSARVRNLADLKGLEKNLIEEKLKQNHGNQRQTAIELGMPKSTLHDRIRLYGIRPHTFI